MRVLSGFRNKDINEALKEIASKWSEEWEKHSLHAAEAEPGKPKFFVTAAFPYTNGPLHLGHALTYTIPDVIARYKRMRGYNALFPMGFHFTGTPIISIAEAVAQNDPRVIKRLLDDGVPPEIIASFSNPINLAVYFKDRAVKSLKSMLYMIDWRRAFTSIDEEFQRFVEWQFHKLREKGLIIQGTHPVGWCPFHQSPVSMHDTLNDVEPEIQEFTLVFFQTSDGTILPAATMRPETVYGVTNLWINPEARYLFVEVEGRRMVVSEEAARKLTFQKKRVDVIGVASPASLLGVTARNPLTEEEVKVMPAKFVDPSTGTGVVMSVPAHAPFDYAALKELGMERDVPPVSIIDVDGRPSFLAVEAVERAGLSSASDSSSRELLERLTKEVYLREFTAGSMSSSLSSRVKDDNLRSFAREVEGKPVEEAREAIKGKLIEMGRGDVFYEIANKPVYCRCGTEVVVKVVENQWFINYEDPDWKRLTLEALRETQIVPEEYREQFQNTVAWLKKKACARSRGLGTPLPWDKSWIIESLSDSTIYMAFYTVVHKIRELGISASSLTKEFWDYVLLGEGDPSEVSKSTGVSLSALESVRREFDYWYPLDNRHSGKDLIPNHLTFMIFNHVAIFPREKWPKRIVVNGHIMVEGRKMSKSLGNFITIDRALSEVSPDVLRLSLILGAEVGNDVNYTRELSLSVSQLLSEIFELVTSVNQSPHRGEGEISEEVKFMEELLESRMHAMLGEVEQLMESYKLRGAAVKIFHEILNELKLHFRVTGIYRSNSVEKAISAWVKMMAPFTPAFAEELWHILGHDSFVVTEEWPSPSSFKHSPRHSLYSKYLRALSDDIASLKKLFLDRREVLVVVASGKPCYPLKLLGGADPAGAARELARQLAREGVQNPFDYSKKLFDFIQSLSEDEKSEIEHLCRDEQKILATASRLLEALSGVSVKVLVEGTGLGELEKVKRQKPLPLRPTIVFV